MKQVDSDALTLLNRVMGLGGAGGAQTTQLEDASITQVIDVTDVVRRSRALASTTGGIFLGVHEHTHGAGATDEASEIDPYRPLTTLAMNSYPGTLSDGFDVWLLGLTGYATGTIANFGSATYEIRANRSQVGWAIDQAGAAIAGAITSEQALVHWDAVTLVGGLNLMLREDGSPWTPLRMRMPRGMSVRFMSSCTNALVLQVQLLIGVFPIGIGQDAVT